MIKKHKPTVQLNVRIAPALNTKLEKLAFRAGMTKGAFVEGTLKLYAELFDEANTAKRK